VCAPTPQQLAKLRIASKGAAEKLANEELSQVLSPGQTQILRILLHPAKEIGEMLEMNEDDE
jgi:hypothetical protein